MTITSADHTCFGDSITWGLGDAAGNGYRRWLQRLVRAARPSFTMNFVGPFTNGDSPTNRMLGVVGAKCADLTALVAGNFPSPYNPKTLTVLAGTNNATDQSSATAFVTDYPAMMSALHSALPSAGFVVSLLPPAGQRQTLIDQLNGLLPGMWTTMESAGYILERTVPRLFGPTDYDPAEGASFLHPSPVGYPQMSLGGFRRTFD